MPVPTFPSGYSVDVPGGQAGFGRWRTLRQLMSDGTVARMHPEHRRRIFAAMLYAYDHGQPCGIGTAWRSPTQQGGTVGGAAVWNSWHQGESPSNDRNSLAADMVPTAAQHWMTVDPVRLAQFGLIAFKVSADSRYWNYEGRSYNGAVELWHWQPWEIRYGRNRRVGPMPLQHRSIPARYDIDIVGLDDPCATWENPPTPPVVPPAVIPPVVVVPPTTPPTPTPTIRRDTVQGPKAYLDPANAAALAGAAEAKADVILFQNIVTGLAAQNPEIAEFRIGIIDGWYGPKSAGACRLLQALSGFDPNPARHLTVDGECGAKTWARILNFD